MKTELGSVHRTVPPRRALFRLVLLAILVRTSTAFAQTYSVESLGTLGGSASEALRINEAGQVVGNISVPAGFPGLAFFYSNGVMTALPSPFGGNFSIAHGINNLGQVTGMATVAGEIATHAFLWSGGSVIDLGTLPGANTSYSYSVGYAVNDFGVVAGESKNEAFIYQQGNMTGFSRRAARTAHDINNDGKVVGVLESNR